MIKYGFFNKCHPEAKSKELKIYSPELLGFALLMLK